MAAIRKTDNDKLQGTIIDRRDVMKLGVGAGAVMAMPAISAATPAEPAPQQGARGRTAQPTSDEPTGGLQRAATGQQWPEIQASKAVVTSTAEGYTVFTGPGWVNKSGRASGNGPMDICTQRLVDFASSFDETKMTPSLIEAINYAMCDTLATLYTGFESEPARINARLASTMRGDMKCTVLGYGIVTTPELAAFTNGAMIRHSDYNPRAHNTEVMGGILAIGEALHSTGLQVMGALVIAYEVIGAINGMHTVVSPGHVEYDANSIHAPGVALACSKLMGLNADQMGNAVSLALMPHLPLYTRIGVQTMWKGTHSSEQVRNGVWAALLAREGMTGPPTPFEGRDGYFAHLGPPTRDMRLPNSRDGRMSLEVLLGDGSGYKRYAAEGTTQTMHEYVIPPLRAWCKPEEVASIEFEVPYGTWQETNDAPKWDPRNRETADHSLPYEFTRHFMDGYIYIDSFSKDKYMDPKARALMNKIICRPNPDPGFLLTVKVRKTSGEERLFPTKQSSPLTHDDLIAKYNKAADFRKIDKAQADRILKQWMNLKDLKDINDAIALAAKFGQPRPLSDKSPGPIA